MDAKEIDLSVVRAILRKSPWPETAAQLAFFGYDKDDVRRIFNEELRLALGLEVSLRT